MFTLKPTPRMTVPTQDELSERGIDMVVRHAYDWSYTLMYDMYWNDRARTAKFAALMEKGDNMQATARNLRNDLLEMLTKNPRFSSQEGRMIKRISKFFHDQIGADMDDNILNELSNTIGNYRFDGCQAALTDALTWERGEFADRHSCFWNERSIDRMILAASHCHALQVWRNGKGIARAFVLPDPERERAFVFNAYGMDLVTMADLFQQVASEYLGYNKLYVHQSRLEPGNKYGSGDGSYRYSTYTNNDTAFVFSPKVLDEDRDSRKVRTGYCRCIASHWYQPGSTTYRTDLVCAHCINEVPSRIPTGMQHNERFEDSDNYRPYTCQESEAATCAK